MLTFGTFGLGITIFSIFRDGQLPQCCRSQTPRPMTMKKELIQTRNRKMNKKMIVKHEELEEDWTNNEDWLKSYTLTRWLNPDDDGDDNHSKNQHDDDDDDYD